ncbi:MAG: hypothetical protein U0T74_04170 [Chitinophagales bacterium]
MKKVFLLSLVFISVLTTHGQSVNFHSYDAKTIHGDTIHLSQYYGKKVMVVNTASYCGYTPQFEDLQQLYSAYQSHNFEIIGFPCNDFNGQDPNGDSAILQFCTANYHVSFQMMSKIEIITGDTSPVYKWLQRADLNGVADAHVAWNFNKFLIDEAGNWIRHYTSTTLPSDTAIINWILSPSIISRVQETGKSDWIKITSGNTVSTNLELNITANLDSKITLQLFSSTGQLVGNIFDNLPSGSGNQRVTYPVENLPSGIYLLKAFNGYVTQTLRVSIVR